MFERFTESGIKVIMLAQEEARRLGHNFVGSEQILLGLIGEGRGVACKRLREAGVQLKDARVQVEKIIGRGSGHVAVEIPFTPRAKRVLETSWKEARQLQHNYIGTEHLLLGILREGDGVAIKILDLLGVDRQKLRQQVLASIGAGDTKLPETPLVPSDTSEISTGAPFSWYSSEATLTIQRAWEIAETAGNKVIEPVHLLLAVLRDNTIYNALKGGQFDLAQLRRDVFSKLEEGDAGAEKSMPFSGEAKKVLESAWQLSFGMDQFFVPPECIFLALLADEGGVLSDALKSMSGDTALVKQFIEHKLKVEKKIEDAPDNQALSALETRSMSANPVVRMAPKTAAIFGLYALVSMTIVLFGVSLINPALFTMLAIAMLIVLLIGLAIGLGAFVFKR